MGEGVEVPCHPGKGDTLDLVFVLNGVPVAMCELKNPMTGQDWRNAVRQYQQDRDPNAPLFRFKRRARVHFAADPDEVGRDRGHHYRAPRGGDELGPDQDGRAAPRADRTAKYNELLRIDENLGTSARYASR